MELRWFLYRQNNSGGVFDVNDRVAVSVFVQASSAADADALATVRGVYFDGCDSGRDCECCGDRWSEAYDDGADEIEPPWDWRQGGGVDGTWNWQDKCPWAGKKLGFRDEQQTAIAYYADGTVRYGVASFAD